MFGVFLVGLAGLCSRWFVLHGMLYSLWHVPLHLNLVSSGTLYVYSRSIITIIVIVVLSNKTVRWVPYLRRVWQAFCSTQFVLHGPFCAVGNVPLQLELVSSDTLYVYSRSIITITVIRKWAWGPYWGVSSRPFAAHNLSCMGHSLLWVMYLFIWNWF